MNSEVAQAGAINHETPLLSDAALGGTVLAASLQY